MRDEYTVELLADYPNNLEAELVAIRHEVRCNALTPERALGKMQEAARLYELKLSLLTEQHNRRTRREGQISPAVERGAFPLATPRHAAALAVSLNATQRVGGRGGGDGLLHL